MAEEVEAPAPQAEFPEEGLIENGERVVYERDEDGNLVGWHKEVV